MRLRAPRAFTLVELLTVIGIVAVLIALLFPALSRAKEHANRIKCAANLRTLGQALTMYTQQSGCYPATWLHFDARLDAIWPFRLRAFLDGNQEVFYCPSQDSSFRWTRGVVPDYLAGRSLNKFATKQESAFGYELGELLLESIFTRFSYGYNGDFPKGLGLFPVGINPDTGRLEGFNVELRASRVKRPSEMIAITDSQADGNHDLTVFPDDSKKYVGTIHGGGANVLYCDGHVEWHRQADLCLLAPQFTPPVLLRQWSRDNEPYP